MGFFFEEETITKPAPRAKTSRAAFDIENAPRGCDNCSLQATWSYLRNPQMEISGNTVNPDILALGEAPGEEEDREGAAFVGESGRMLRRAIPGRDIMRVAFQNAVRCHPKGNATPSARDQHACSLYLEEDVERFNFKAILGIGSVPMARFWYGWPW